ncbi:MAG: endonuclease domain-containing protein [Sphingobacteriales bacterium JAD_PAG50586_3]|nr:MAG: endonuclease domain-containing protein [Sphingobacteriales bacterium JAD_PAG50586_3]
MKQNQLKKLKTTIILAAPNYLTPGPSPKGRGVTMVYFMATEMHGDAVPKIFENARVLRKELTFAEKVLWNEIRSRKLNGYKFRRQHVISLYIADFYCHESKLAIELDGGYHNTKDRIELDKLRTEVLNDFGITVLRFTNIEVLDNLDFVIETIKTHLTPLEREHNF